MLTQLVGACTCLLPYSFDPIVVNEPPFCLVRLALPIRIFVNLDYCDHGNLLLGSAFGVGPSCCDLVFLPFFAVDRSIPD